MWAVSQKANKGNLFLPLILKFVRFRLFSVVSQTSLFCQTSLFRPFGWPVNLKKCRHSPVGREWDRCWVSIEKPRQGSQDDCKHFWWHVDITAETGHERCYVHIGYSEVFYELQWLRDFRSISVESMFIWAYCSMNIYFKVYAAGLCYCWPNLWQRALFTSILWNQIKRIGQNLSEIFTCFGVSSLCASTGKHAKIILNFTSCSQS